MIIITIIIKTILLFISSMTYISRHHHHHHYNHHHFISKIITIMTLKISSTITIIFVITNTYNNHGQDKEVQQKNMPPELMSLSFVPNNILFLLLPHLLQISSQEQPSALVSLVTRAAEPRSAHLSLDGFVEGREVFDVGQRRGRR